MKRFLMLFGFFCLIFFGCELEPERTPEKIERDKIMESENLLTNNSWDLSDFKVSVQYESQVILLLANADENNVVMPDICYTYDIFGNDNCKLNYPYEFLNYDIETAIYKLQNTPPDNDNLMLVDYILQSDFVKNIDETIL